MGGGGLRWAQPAELGPPSWRAGRGAWPARALWYSLSGQGSPLRSRGLPSNKCLIKFLLIRVPYQACTQRVPFWLEFWVFLNVLSYVHRESSLLPLTRGVVPEFMGSSYSSKLHRAPQHLVTSSFPDSKSKLPHLKDHLDTWICSLSTGGSGALLRVCMHPAGDFSCGADPLGRWAFQLRKEARVSPP